MLLILCFMLGATIGSFLFLVGQRTPLKQSILSPASHCPNCKKNLVSFDLIPVFSYLLLNKKCRYCRHKIPSLSFFIELFCGFFGVFLLLTDYLKHLTFTDLLLIIMLILLSITDLLYYLVEPFILYVFTALIFSIIILKGQQEFYIITAVAIYLLLSLLDRLLPNSLGGGDIKLLTILAFFLGWHSTIHLLFLASLFAVLFFVFAHVCNQPLKKIPFVPFLAIASLLILLFP